MDNCILVAVTEIEMYLKGKKNLPLVERIKYAMQKASNHWLVTNEDDQFRAAIGAVLVTANEEEKEKINSELKLLKALSAAATGVSVDFTQLFAQLPVSETEPLGLRGIWQEVKEAKNEKPT